MVDHFYAVIMAGGGGTRLWPVSRQASPKQMLKLFGDQSLFQIAVDRLAGLFDPQQIFVVTVIDQVAALQDQAPQLPPENYLIEPMPRGTAAVVAMAAATLLKSDPHAVLAILTADHFIKNIAGFQDVLKAAYETAKTERLVTLGIKPTYAATGYGYIEHSKQIGIYNGIPAYEVNRFIEKPTEAVAKEFLKKETINWNSGMFIWRAETILDEIGIYMPELWDVLGEIVTWLGEEHSSQQFIEAWSSIRPQTIDYGIMEKSHRCAVIPVSDLGWNDVGSWDSLFEVIQPDAQGNIIIKAKHIGLESGDSLFYSSTLGKLIVTSGISDLIVIDTPDALMICPRGESQRVKDLVNYLRDNQYIPFL